MFKTSINFEREFQKKTYSNLRAAEFSRIFISRLPSNKLVNMSVFLEVQWRNIIKKIFVSKFISKVENWLEHRIVFFHHYARARIHDLNFCVHQLPILRELSPITSYVILKCRGMLGLEIHEFLLDDKLIIQMRILLKYFVSSRGLCHSFE